MLSFSSTEVLWSRIPEELIEKTLKQYDRNNNREQKTLRACLYISQQFRRIALPLAYCTVKWQGKANSPIPFLPLLTFLTAYEGIASTITSLTLEGNNRWAVDRCNQAFHSQLTLCTLVKILLVLPSLQRLTICHVSLRPCTVTRHEHNWTKALPRLGHLYVHEVHTTQDQHYGFLSSQICAIFKVLDIQEFHLDKVNPVLGCLPQNTTSRRQQLSISAMYLFQATYTMLLCLRESTGLKALQFGLLDWGMVYSVQRVLDSHGESLEELGIYFTVAEDPVGKYHIFVCIRSALTNSCRCITLVSAILGGIRKPENRLLQHTAHRRVSMGYGGITVRHNDSLDQPAPSFCSQHASGH